MISSVGNLYVADEIREMVKTHNFFDETLCGRLEALASENEKLYTTNTAALKLKDGSITEIDMIIALNLHRSYIGSSIED